MRIVLSVLALMFAVVGSAPASARAHHHHKHHVHHRHHSHRRHHHHRVNRVHHVTEQRSGSQPSVDQTVQRLPQLGSLVESSARPRECYSVGPWCGCFMRHLLGIADKAYNLARNWAGIGQRTSAHSGAIVVWRHHVGMLRSEPDARGRALVLSGNDGHRVRERVRSLQGAIAFREL